jgi:hypothetical protein
MGFTWTFTHGITAQQTLSQYSTPRDYKILAQTVYIIFNYIHLKTKLVHISFIISPLYTYISICEINQTHNVPYHISGSQRPVSWQPRFNPGSSHARYVADKMELGQVSSKYFLISPVTPHSTKCSTFITHPITDATIFILCVLLNRHVKKITYI